MTVIDTGLIMGTAVEQVIDGSPDAGAWPTEGYYVLSNILSVGGDTYALVFLTDIESAIVEEVCLYYSGTGFIGTTKELEDNIVGAPEWTKGSSTDLWGLDAHDSRFLDDEFGVGVRISVYDGATRKYSYWAIAKGFGLGTYISQCPDVKGIEVIYKTGLWTGGFEASGFNYIGFKVYYEPHRTEPYLGNLSVHPNHTGCSALYGDDESQPTEDYALDNSSTEYSTSNLNEVSALDSGYVQATYAAAFPEHLFKLKVFPIIPGKATRVKISSSGVGYSHYTDPDSDEYIYQLYVYNNDTSVFELKDSETQLDPETPPEYFSLEWEETESPNSYINTSGEIWLCLAGTATGSTDWTRVFYVEADLDGYCYPPKVSVSHSSAV